MSDKPRYEVCWRCRQEWNVSKQLPQLKTGEVYLCPMCTRKGEKPIVRRK